MEQLHTDNVVGGGTTVAFDQPVSRLVALSPALWNALSRTMRWACGAYVFCRRDAFEAVGGFDERFYASEEIHLSGRLKRWGRKHGKRMVILRRPILTSPRKAEWFSIGRLLRMLLRFALWPRSVRRRDACWMWYERPDK